MRIALVNSVILNGGDAGIVYGTCDAIKEVIPSAEIDVYAHSAKASAHYYPDLNILPMPFEAWPESRIARAVMRKTYGLRHAAGLRSSGEREFLRSIAASDAVVYCGGGYMNDSYDMKLLFNIIEATLGTGKPHMAYAHSIGPIRRQHTATETRRLLNRFEAVTVRDEASHALLRKIGVEESRIRLLADAALAMHPHGIEGLSETDRASIGQIEEFDHDESPLVFISVRRWRFPGSADSERLTRNLYQQLRVLVEGMLSRTNWKICFVSTCQGRGEYTYDDSAVARQILADLAESDSRRVMVCSNAFSPRAYPYLIRKYADLVISMRMHMTIFSLLGGVPFVALAYEQKSVELCRRLGASEYCHEVAGIDAEAVLRTSMRLYERRTVVRESLRRSLNELGGLSRQNAVLLEGFLRR